jgi:hypothetical protein
MRRRVVMILFLPVVVFIFFVGWIFNLLGDRRVSNKTASERKTDGSLEEALAADDGAEMRLIEETVKEQLAD